MVESIILKYGKVLETISELVDLFVDSHSQVICVSVALKVKIEVKGERRGVEEGDNAFY